MQIRYLSHSSAGRPGLLRKSAAIAATVVVAGVAVMFSAVILAALLFAGAVAGVYLWWKTRELRKHLRNMPPRDAANEGAFQGAPFRHEAFREEGFKGEIIEGEVIRVDDSRERG